MSFFPPMPGKTANGNISPRRFLTSVTGSGNANKVVQASAATAMIVGISANTTRFPPGSPADDGYCAVSGEPVPYHGIGHICDLDIGGTVSNAGVFLSADSSGKGVSTALADGTEQFYGALALETGVDGDTIRVYVISPFAAK